MPKIVDREAMQQSILDAAMQVFSERGYHAATIAHVAEAAGLGKGTLYLYFDSKEALAEALVDAHFQKLEARFTALPTPATLDAFVDGIAKTLQVPEQEARFVRVFFEVFGPSFASDAFTARVAGFFDRLGSHYAASLAALRELGKVRRDIDPKVTGRALTSCVDGLILHRGLLGLSNARYAAMRREALALFARGLAP